MSRPVRMARTLTYIQNAAVQKFFSGYVNAVNDNGNPIIAVSIPELIGGDDAPMMVALAMQQDYKHSWKPVWNDGYGIPTDIIKLLISMIASSTGVQGQVFIINQDSLAFLNLPEFVFATNTSEAGFYSVRFSFGRRRDSMSLTGIRDDLNIIVTFETRAGVVAFTKNTFYRDGFDPK